MTAPATSTVSPVGIPPEAMPEWLRLADVLGSEGPAPCELEPDEWWPEKGTPTSLAVRCCNGCPARDACLDYALTANERGGLWGGLVTSERDALRRSLGLEPSTPVPPTNIGGWSGCT